MLGPSFLIQEAIQQPLGLLDAIALQGVNLSLRHSLHVRGKGRIRCGALDEKRYADLTVLSHCRKQSAGIVKLHQHLEIQRTAFAHGAGSV
jgi:hypothetical protein